VIYDYIKIADIFLICHSFDRDFNEEKIRHWVETIEKFSHNRNIYLIGCKYDIKVMNDYLAGQRITSLTFQNDNLTSFGERIKTFINNPEIKIKAYYITSALLNFNVKEMFNSILKDYIYNLFMTSKGKATNVNQNCYIF
jgi:hypothetical protein